MDFQSHSKFYRQLQIFFSFIIMNITPSEDLVLEFLFVQFLAQLSLGTGKKIRTDHLGNVQCCSVVRKLGSQTNGT